MPSYTSKPRLLLKKESYLEEANSHFTIQLDDSNRHCKQPVTISCLISPGQLHLPTSTEKLALIKVKLHQPSLISLCSSFVSGQCHHPSRNALPRARIQRRLHTKHKGSLLHRVGIRHALTSSKASRFLPSPKISVYRNSLFEHPTAEIPDIQKNPKGEPLSSRRTCASVSFKRRHVLAFVQSEKIQYSMFITWKADVPVEIHRVT